MAENDSSSSDDQKMGLDASGLFQTADKVVKAVREMSASIEDQAKKMKATAKAGEELTAKFIATTEAGDKLTEEFKITNTQAKLLASNIELVKTAITGLSSGTKATIRYNKDYAESLKEGTKALQDHIEVMKMYEFAQTKRPVRNKTINESTADIQAALKAEDDEKIRAAMWRNVTSGQHIPSGLNPQRAQSLAQGFNSAEINNARDVRNSAEESLRIQQEQLIAWREAQIVARDRLAIAIRTLEAEDSLKAKMEAENRAAWDAVSAEQKQQFLADRKIKSLTVEAELERERVSKQNQETATLQQQDALKQKLVSDEKARLKAVKEQEAAEKEAWEHANAHQKGLFEDHQKQVAEAARIEAAANKQKAQDAEAWRVATARQNAAFIKSQQQAAVEAQKAQRGASATTFGNNLYAASTTNPNLPDGNRDKIANQIARINALIRSGAIETARAEQIVAAVQARQAAVFEGAELKVANATRAIMAANGTLKNLDVQSVVLQGNRFAKTMKEMEQESKRSTAAILFNFQNMSRLLTVQLLHTAIREVINLLGAAVTRTEEFELRISEIRTISQDSGISFEQWAAAARHLSDEFGNPVLDTAEGLYEAISAQIVKGANAATFMGRALEFSRVTMTSAKDSVALLSSVINSYATSSTDAQRISAILFKTIELGTLRGGELAQNFGKVGPFARALGVSLEEVAASMTTLTRAGVPEADAVVQLTNVLSALTKPTKEMKELFKEWGVSTGEGAIQLFSYAGVLDKLTEATRNSSEEIAKLFPNLRGLRGDIGFSSNLSGFHKDLTDISENALPQYQKAVQITFESASSAIKIETNKIANYVQSDFAAPLIKGVIDLSRAMNKDGLSGIFKESLPVLATATAAYAAYRTALLLTAGATRAATVWTLGETQATAINTNVRNLATQARVEERAAMAAQTLADEQLNNALILEAELETAAAQAINQRTRAEALSTAATTSAVAAAEARDAQIVAETALIAARTEMTVAETAAIRAREVAQAAHASAAVRLSAIPNDFQSGNITARNAIIRESNEARTASVLASEEALAARRRVHAAERHVQLTTETADIARVAAVEEAQVTALNTDTAATQRQMVAEEELAAATLVEANTARAAAVAAAEEALAHNANAMALRRAQAAQAATTAGAQRFGNAMRSLGGAIFNPTFLITAALTAATWYYFHVKEMQEEQNQANAKATELATAELGKMTEATGQELDKQERLWQQSMNKRFTIFTEFGEKIMDRLKDAYEAQAEVTKQAVDSAHQGIQDLIRGTESDIKKVSDSAIQALNNVRDARRDAARDAEQAEEQAFRRKMAQAEHQDRLDSGGGKNLGLVDKNQIAAAQAELLRLQAKQTALGSAPAGDPKEAHSRLEDVKKNLGAQEKIIEDFNTRRMKMEEELQTTKKQISDQELKIKNDQDADAARKAEAALRAAAGGERADQKRKRGKKGNPNLDNINSNLDATKSAEEQRREQERAAAEAKQLANLQARQKALEDSLKLVGTQNEYEKYACQIQEANNKALQEYIKIQEDYAKSQEEAAKKRQEEFEKLKLTLQEIEKFKLDKAIDKIKNGDDAKKINDNFENLFKRAMSAGLTDNGTIARLAKEQGEIQKETELKVNEIKQKNLTAELAQKRGQLEEERKATSGEIRKANEDAAKIVADMQGIAGVGPKAEGGIGTVLKQYSGKGGGDFIDTKTGTTSRDIKDLGIDLDKIRWPIQRFMEELQKATKEGRTVDPAHLQELQANIAALQNRAGEVRSSGTWTRDAGKLEDLSAGERKDSRGFALPDTTFGQELAKLANLANELAAASLKQNEAVKKSWDQGNQITQFMNQMTQLTGSNADMKANADKAAQSLGSLGEQTLRLMESMGKMKAYLDSLPPPNFVPPKGEQPAAFNNNVSPYIPSQPDAGEKALTVNFGDITINQPSTGSPVADAREIIKQIQREVYRTGLNIGSPVA